jgi:tRNA pseudouridine13 synthase
MRSPFELDRWLGLEYYITSTPGVGGKLRYRPEDFYVEEIPLGKSSNAEAGHGEYVVFTLEKLNWDTITAIKALAKALNLSPKRFGYAGNKDKRALTKQRVSVREVEAEKLRSLSLPGIVLSDFASSDRGIVLGDLKGNWFRITARGIDIDGLKEKLMETNRELAAKGVPNYFGYQRFGVVRPNTHLVGRELVRGSLEGAVTRYLGSPFPKEKPDAQEARAYLDETLDYKEALKRFPTRLKYERAMLNHLVRNPRDYAGALRRLPKKLGILLVHAYQSYLFNRVLSRLIEEEIPLKGIRIPLFGYDTTLSEGRLGEIEREVLEEEGVGLKNFWIRSMPELSTKGFLRDACIEAEVKFTVREDELNPRRQAFTACFTLPKGSYATVVMREFMKTEPLNY